MGRDRDAIWASEDEAKLLRRRAMNFWNADYLERVVLPLLELPRGARVLDVGSGYGGLSLPLAKAAPEVMVIGIDLEPKAVREALAAAEALGLRNVGFRNGDATSLPFEDASFDTVVCQTLLTHVAEPERVLAEMVRVLRPGGTFFAVEYHNQGVLSAHDTVTSEEPPVETVLERFRLAQLYIRGKKALGRGDDTLGVRLPFMLPALGLKILNVRKNDRAWHAFPPYLKESERLALATMRDFAEPTGEAMRNWVADNIRAGGGSDEDVRRHFELADDPELKGRMRARIDSGDYAHLSSYPFYLTFARKADA